MGRPGVSGCSISWLGCASTTTGSSPKPAPDRSTRSIRLLRPFSLLVARVLSQSCRKSRMPKWAFWFRGSWSLAAVRQGLSGKLLKRIGSVNFFQHDRHHARPEACTTRMEDARNLQRTRSRQLLQTCTSGIRLNQSAGATHQYQTGIFHDPLAGQARVSAVQPSFE